MKNNINSDGMLVILMTILALLIFGLITFSTVGLVIDGRCAHDTINQIKSGDVPARCAK